MGILSHGLIGVLQAGHDEDGFIIEMFLGNLYIQTFRNDPTIRPNIKIIAVITTFQTNKFCDPAIRMGL
jgi:hypothetical protein